MSQKKILVLCLATSMLAACTEPNGAPGRGIENGGAVSKTDVGVAAGVVTGGLIGSAIGGGAGNVVAIIGGGLLGGWLGGEIGQSMDNADRAAYDRASRNAMESGHSQSWKNSNTGHYGAVHPHHRYRDADGRTCRQYTQTITIDGKSHQAHGRACRQDDGSWKIAD